VSAIDFAERFEMSDVKNLLERALISDELDLAIGPIQQALQIKDADAVVSSFAGLGQRGWRTLSLDHRRVWLAEWLREEIWKVEV